MQARTPRQPSRGRRSAQSTYGWLAFIALLILGALLYWWSSWDFYWVWLAVVNVVTFLLFRHDKGQAQRSGATRVPEVILLTLVLAGGVIGGAGGMLLRPRHKTQKSLFWVALAVALGLHIYLLAQFVLR